MNKQMRNNKGITLSSLIIYIVLMFFVLAILTRMMNYYTSNLSDMADVTVETQIEKINIYFLDEVQRKGNKIELISENKITFTSGNRYTFISNDKTIYLNDNIKICENIDTCQFDKEEINNKTIIKVKIQIGEENKLQQYVMKNGEQEGASIKEEDYILNRLIESSNVTTE